MEIRKTTLLSFLVCIAGILAEIIFRDVLAKSAFGVALSVALAVVIIVLAYYFYDGFYSFLAAEREMDKKRQEGYDQKLYSVLNEQLQFEKAIYKEVYTLMQESEGADKVSVNVLEEYLERLKASVNEHTTATVQIVSKDVNQTADQTKELFEQNRDDIKTLTEGQEVMEKIQTDLQILFDEKAATEQIQEDVRKLLEKQPESTATSASDLNQLQSDIQTIITNESDLKQHQSEMQLSIRKLAEILSVMLSLMRGKKANTEKSQ